MPIKPTVLRSPTTPIAKTLPEIMKSLKEISTFLKEHYLERENAIKQMVYAIITHQHVLFFGGPGTAKSRLVKSFMSCFKGINTFSKQLSKYMPEEALIGSLNPRLLREQGIYEYNTTGTLVDSHIAYLDEVFDANDATLRSTLEILNERIFSKGHQIKECPLVSCFMASNFHREDKNIEAFCDRIVFKNNLNALSEKRSRTKMVSNYVLDDAVPVFDGDKLTLADLKFLRSSLKEVTFDPKLIDLYVSFVHEFSTQTRINVTDRKLNTLTLVMKASALARGDKKVSFDDFQSLEYGLYVQGDNTDKHNHTFDTLLVKYSKHVIGFADNLLRITNRVDSLLSRVDLKADGKILEDLLNELKSTFDVLEKTEKEIMKAGILKNKEEEAQKIIAALTSKCEKAVDEILSITESLGSN